MTDVADKGIIIDVSNTIWNHNLTQLEELSLSVQYKKEDGSLSTKTEHTFIYNALTEGTVLFLQYGDKAPLHLLAHNQNLLIKKDEYNDLPDMVFRSETMNNRIYSNFTHPFDAINKANKIAAISFLSSKLEQNNKLISTIQKERDPGLKTYSLRYYYNGRRLNGSLGIHDQDMSCDAVIKQDTDGVLSLFVNTDVELSIHASIND